MLLDDSNILAVVIRAEAGTCPDCGHQWDDHDEKGRCRERRCQCGHPQRPPARRLPESIAMVRAIATINGEHTVLIP